MVIFPHVYHILGDISASVQLDTPAETVTSISMNALITHAEMELPAMMESECLPALVRQVLDTHSHIVMVRCCVFSWLRMMSR